MIPSPVTGIKYPCLPQIRTVPQPFFLAVALWEEDIKRLSADRQFLGARYPKASLSITLKCEVNRACLSDWNSRTGKGTKATSLYCTWENNKFHKTIYTREIPRFPFSIDLGGRQLPPLSQTFRPSTSGIIHQLAGILSLPLVFSPLYTGQPVVPKGPFLLWRAAPKDHNFDTVSGRRDLRGERMAMPSCGRPKKLMEIELVGGCQLCTAKFITATLKHFYTRFDYNSLV